MGEINNWQLNAKRMTGSTTVTLPDVEIFKAKALYWANYFKTVCLLDSNNYSHSKYIAKDWILAVDATDELTSSTDAFEQLKQFQAKANSIIFGFLTYELKDQIENLQSKHADNIKLPVLYFFKPRYVIEITEDKVTINRNYPETFELLELIGKINLAKQVDTKPQQLLARTSREKYLSNVAHIKQQIEEGDFYELNYCNEFYANGTEVNAADTFLRLNDKARAPFSAFFKWHDKYVMCASPERFLKKEGDKLISQPIKGTIRRSANAEENKVLQAQLKNDIKERAENVMIVDLVRNDLAKSSVSGSVKVEELFGVYEFNSVNHMISTVVSQLNSNTHFVDAIKNAFPIGSMTGAPKIEVMKNIERYEDFYRGVYSGSIGYITPEGDFDLNVVIRSISYNATDKYLSIQVGGAITYDSIPEKEYDEILLKAQNMLEVLKATAT